MRSRVELLSLAALALAIFALRRTRDHVQLRQRVEALETQLAALRAGGAAGPVDDARADAASAVVAPDTTPVADVVDVARPPSGDELLDEPLPGEVPPSEDAGEPPPPTEPPPPAGSQIDWERWIGVRGAAVLGGGVLALAGLFFFRYSIEHGLIPPWLRVVMGTLAGLGCIVAAERGLRRDYGRTADALAGAGVVLLYASFWAAGPRYGIVGNIPTFVLLTLVTVAGGVLAKRHESQVIAVLGLLGGFLTPVFASSGANRPIGLFGYLLLLDVGLLLLARQQGWPWLAVLALAGTAIYQGLWIGAQMGPGQLLIGLTVLATFALTFAVGAPRGGERDRRWLAAQAGGVLVPFAFAIHLAGRADLPGLLPLGGLLVILSVAAAWTARVQAAPAIGLAAATGALGVLVVWLGQHDVPLGIEWRFALVSVALALPFHVAASREDEEVRWRGVAPAAAVAALGHMMLQLGVGTESSDPRPWAELTALLALAAMLVRQGGRAGMGPLQLAGAAGVALGLLVFELVHAGNEAAPGPWTWLATAVAIAVGFQATALWRGHPRAQRWHLRAAALVALASCPLVWIVGPDSDVLLRLGGTLLLGVLAALAATRLGSGRWLFATALVLPFVQTAMPDETLAQLLLTFAGVALFTAWPTLVPARLREDRWAWRAAALAAPPWMPSLLATWEHLWGDAAIGLVPILLAVVLVAVAQRAQTLFADDHPVRVSAMAWLLAVALGFVTVAVPIQLDRSWLTIAWALEGVAVIALWQRLDHPGLKWFGLALLGAVTVRLVANPEVLAYWPRPGWRLVNWITYTYLVPAAALFGAARLLEPLEVPRLRDAERQIYVGDRPIGAMAAGLAGLAVVFVWVNLMIADWFSTGDVLQLDFERLPARDLATSIAWALYALLLLALGVRRRSGGLRWVSLGLMMVTIAKVFLYDLGELQDLYRVASLLGLAISLILVSLAYQRFVLRRDEPEEPEA
jgi:uncharacterized membrane protein